MSIQFNFIEINIEFVYGSLMSMSVPSVSSKSHVMASINAKFHRNKRLGVLLKLSKESCPRFIRSNETSSDTQ